MKSLIKKINYLLFMFIWLGIFFLAPNIFAAKNEIYISNILRTWTFANERLNSVVGTIKKYEQLKKEEWAIRSDVAKELARLYFLNELDFVVLKKELQGVDGGQNFFDTLHAEFFNETVERLKRSNSNRIKVLMKHFDKANENGVLLFRLTGDSFDVESPTSSKAGFHRGAGSIFMDLARVSPEEWLIVFIHELLHALDPYVNEAMQEYAKSELVLEFAKLSKKFTRLDQLTPKDQNNLVRWIKAGLGRGLWAEYRAWVITILIYEEGLKEKLWPRINWMEAIFSERKKNEELKAFIYRYLNQRSIDPKEEINSRPLIQNALKEVRQATALSLPQNMFRYP